MIISNSVRDGGGVSVETAPSGSGYIGCIAPNIPNAQWIMWFEENGDAVLYTQREASGGIMGEPIYLKASDALRTR